MKNVFTPLLFLGLLMAGCTTDDLDDMDIEAIQNIPVTTNVANAFTYVVKADGFSQQINSSLNFDSTAFVLSLVVADYSSGELSMAIYNEDSSQVYRQQITSNMVFTDFPEFQPTALEMDVDGFSGSLTLTVAVE
ncbi:MAG: hypothetical protein CMB80_32795 [Flammeovirgaceae bacterium]|mgnify:CR=1 FL=1|nr:hypothetical protein [Flammeovirgaceae bacterium]MBE62148.1 hypothetical protein [Flammeovirgaceae bacterium]HCX22411.1 hypothetical protein [Cytophagales bacterium]|tara:strand:- start:2216 stop:2620 length:405 start_codon:yes stop_codon:yes gene_type:complete